MRGSEGIEIPPSLRSLLTPPEANSTRSEETVAFYEQLEEYAKSSLVQPGNQQISFIDSNVSGLNVHHDWNLGSWEDARDVADQLLAPLQTRFGTDSSGLNPEELLSQHRMVYGGLRAVRRIIGEILGEKTTYDEYLAEVLGVGHYNFEDELFQETRNVVSQRLAKINRADCYNDFDLEKVFPEYRIRNRLGTPTLMDEVFKAAESTTEVMSEYVDLASLPPIYRSPRDVIQFIYERDRTTRMESGVKDSKPVMKVNFARQFTRGEGDLIGGRHEWLHILELGMLSEYIKKGRVLPELGVLLSYAPQLIYGEGIAQTNRLFMPGIRNALNDHAHLAAEWRYVRDLALLKACYIIHRDFINQPTEGVRAAMKYLEPRVRPFVARSFLQMDIDSIVRTLHGKSYGGPVYGASTMDLTEMATVLENDDNRKKFITLTFGLPVIRDQQWFITNELKSASAA